MEQRRLRVLRRRVQLSVRVRRTGNLRRPARRVRSKDCRLHICRTHGNRCRHCFDCTAQRPASADLPRYCIYRMHAVRTRKRDCGSRRHQIHCQMVQGRKRSLRHGSAGGGSKTGHGRSFHIVTCHRKAENARRDLFSCRHLQAGSTRTDPDYARSASLGHIRSDGRPV